MIFVTVGTTYFDPLIRCIDQAAANGTIRDEVVLQIGHGGEYIPRCCPYFRVAPTLELFERSASLIIGHGGTGTTLEVLAMEKPLISVANPALQDNHQHEFLAALEQRGFLTYCRNLDELPEMISARKVRKYDSISAGSQLAVAIDLQIGSLPRPIRGANPWLMHFANWFARKSEIEVTRTLRQPYNAGDLWPLLINPREQEAARP